MISVCILTKNSERSLSKTLDSVRHFREVVILDTGSNDRTLQIAKSYPNVTIHTQNFCGFGNLRNAIASKATNDWIFALDSDEILSDELSEEILRLTLDPRYAYSMWRKNYLNGKWIKGCGWYPDRVVRLYNKKSIRYGEQKVHESLESHETIFLLSPLLHTPYITTHDFLEKMQLYSSLFAEENKGKIGSSFGKALFRGFFAFIKSYFLKKGFLFGAEGFTISLYNANTTFYKYLKLKELLNKS